MKRLPKQHFTLEFKLEAVRQVDGLGKRPADVARELGIVEQTLHSWLKANREGQLTQVAPGAKAVTPEQMELSRLLAENARLKQEVEILKKATAYFAKDQL